MDTKAITIEVDAAAADAYAAAPGEQRRKIQLLLSMYLRDITLKPRRPLREVMRELAAEAADNGLTPEILESILREDCHGNRPHHH